MEEVQEHLVREGVFLREVKLVREVREALGVLHMVEDLLVR